MSSPRGRPRKYQSEAEAQEARRKQERERQRARRENPEVRSAEAKARSKTRLLELGGGGTTTQTKYPGAGYPRDGPPDRNWEEASVVEEEHYGELARLFPELDRLKAPRGEEQGWGLCPRCGEEEVVYLEGGLWGEDLGPLRGTVGLIELNRSSARGESCLATVVCPRCGYWMKVKVEGDPLLPGEEPPVEMVPDSDRQATMRRDYGSERAGGTSVTPDDRQLLSRVSRPLTRAEERALREEGVANRNLGLSVEKVEPIRQRTKEETAAVLQRRREERAAPNPTFGTVVAPGFEVYTESEPWDERTRQRRYERGWTGG
jgi:hypothetical protein